MKHIVKFLAVVVLSISATLSSVPSAQAGTITQTFSRALSPTVWADTWNLARVNLIPGGTLTDVQLIVTGRWSSSISVFNTTNTLDTAISAKTELKMSLYGSSSLFNNDYGFDGNNAYLADTFVGSSKNFTLAAFASTNFSKSANIPAVNINYYSTTYDLSEFQGSGSLPITLDAVSSSLLGITGNGYETESTSAGYTMYVIYTYTGAVVPTPEPSAGILFGVGGLACCGWKLSTRRRRNRNKLVADNIDA